MSLVALPSPVQPMRAQQNRAHPERVFHLDDAALQDGRADRRDLERSTVPRHPPPGAHHVPAQGGHHRPLLLHGAAGDEGLGLGDVGLGHHRARR